MSAATGGGTPNITPTIIIGLGGTGREVLLRLRRRVYERYGPLEQFPIVSYLYIDTDATDTHHSDETRVNKLITRQIDFKPGERVEAGIRNPSAYINNPNDHPHIAAWFPPDMAIAGDMVAGAAQVRARGRLSFFVNYVGIKKALLDARTQVQAQDSRTAINRWNLQATGELNVYMIGSVAGGTGSGTFLDMTYLVRDIIPEAKRVGFLLLPRAFGEAQGEPKMWANGYAALKELDYFQLGGRTLSREPRIKGAPKKLGFPAEWEKHKPLSGDAAMSHPFDFTYLIDGYNEAGVNQVTERIGLYQLIADAIFHDFGQRDFSEKKKAHVWDNLRPYISHWWEEPNTGRIMPTRYSSLGLASISFPADRVKLACAAKLSLEVVEYWTRRRDDTSVSLAWDTMMEKFMSPLGLVEGQFKDGKRTVQRSDILNGLTRRGDGATAAVLRQDIKSWHDDMAGKVLERSAKTGKSPRQYLEEQVSLLERNFTGRESANPADRGPYIRQIHENRQTMSRTIKEQIYKLVQTLVKDQYSGIGYALEVLSWMAQIFEKTGDGYLDTFRKGVKDLEEKVTRRQGMLNRALTELGYYHTNVWDRHPLRQPTVRHLADKAVDASRAYFYDLLEMAARQQAVLFCEEILRYIATRDVQTGDSAGLRARLQGLVEDLGRLKGRLEEKLDGYTGAVRSPRTILLYDAAQLDEIYTRYVKHDQIPEISQQFQEARGINLLDFSVGSQADVRADEMMEFSRARFTPIDRDYNALDMFYDMFGDPQRRQTELGNLLRAAQVWVKWASDTSRGPTLELSQQRFVVGYSHPDKNRGKAFEDEITGAYKSGKDIDFFPIDSPHEIIFYTETGGFALSRLEALRFMKDAYQQHRDRSIPLHIDRPENRFPDIAMPDQREIEDLKEATDLFHMARAMSAFEAVVTADGAVQYRFHQYMGPALGTKPRTLGDAERAPEQLRRDQELRRAVMKRVMGLRSVIFSESRLLMGYAALCRWYAGKIFGPEEVNGYEWNPPEQSFYRREANGAVDDLQRNGEFDLVFYENLAETVGTPQDSVSMELADGYRLLRWTPPSPAELA